jgi:MFS family permease
MWVLFGVTLINRTGTMFLPFLALYLTNRLGFSAVHAGAVLAIYGAGAFVAAPLAGRLADRFGAVKVMRASLLASGMLLVLFPLAKSPAAIAILSFVLSIASEAFRPASLTIVTHLVPPERRRSAFALSRLAVNLGMSVGPAAGGFLATVSFPALFWVDGVTSLLAGATLAFSSLADVPRTASPAPARERRVGLSDPAFVWFLAAVFPVAVVFFQHESTMSLFLVRDLAIATWIYGLLHTINTVLIVFLEVPINLATAHWPHRRTLALGSFLVAAGFGALAFVHDTPSAALTVVVWTFGEMILLPGMAAYVAEIAPEDRRGAYMGLYSMAFSAAFAAGPLLGTVLLERLGARPLWGVMFGLGALSAAMMARVKTRPSS